MIRTITPFDPSASDGCSVPILRHLCPRLASGWWREACRRHDDRYHYGGPWIDRLVADLLLAPDIVLESLDRWWLVKLPLGLVVACVYFAAVRIGGAPWWARLFPALGPDYLWGFGIAREARRLGGTWRNEYTVQPAGARR